MASAGFAFRRQADGGAYRGRPCARAAELAVLGSINVKQREEELLTDEERDQEALFRHVILGELLSRNLRRGQLRLERCSTQPRKPSVATSLV